MFGLRCILLRLGLGAAWLSCAAQVPAPGQLLTPEKPAGSNSAARPAPALPAPADPKSGPNAQAVPSTPLAANASPSSTSSSGQFIVHGDNLTLRSAIASRCDEIDTELRQLLRDRVPWTLPIVVMLHAPSASATQANAVRLTLSEITHGGFHLQLDVALRPDLQPSQLRAEVVRALLAERVLRQQKGSPKREQLLPQWMYLGVLEALDYRRNARPSALFAAIFKSGKVYSIEEIIDAEIDALDGLSKTIYRNSCCALVLALLDQPEGSTRLQRFLATLAADSRPLKSLLDEAFPSFATSPTSLNKWWALQLANLSRPGLSEPLSIQESLSALQDALTLRFKAKPSELPAPKALASNEDQEPSSPKPETTEPSPNPNPSQTADGMASRVFRWLNPFSRRRNSGDAILEDAIVETNGATGDPETPSQPEVALPAPTQEESRVKASDEQRPWYNRWFGGKASTSKPQTSPNPQAEDEEQPPKKRHWLRWLRPSSSSISTPPKTTSERSNPWLREWTEPMVALVQQSSAQPSATAEAPKKRFGFFSRNSGTAAPTAAPAAPPAAAAPQPAKSDSGERKSSSKSRSKKSASRLPESLVNQPAINEKPAQASAAATPPTQTPPSTAPRKRGLLGIFANPASSPATANTPPAKPATATPPPPSAPASKGKAKGKKTSADQAASPSPAAAPAPPNPAPAPANPNPTAAPRKRGLLGLFDSSPKPAPPAPSQGMTPPAGSAANPAPAAGPAALDPANAQDALKTRAPRSTSRLPDTLLRQPSLNATEAAAPMTPPQPAPTTAPAAAAASVPPTAAAPTTAPPQATPRKRGFLGLFDNQPKASAGNPPAAMTSPEAQPAVTPPTASPLTAEKPLVRSGSKSKAQASRSKSTSKSGSNTESKKTAPKPKPSDEGKPMAAEADKPKAEAKPQAAMTEPNKTESKPADPPKAMAADAAKPAADEPLVDAVLAIENFEVVLKREDRQEIFKRCLTALSVLQQRSAVLLRPIIGKYLVVVSELSQGKNRDAAKRLGELRRELTKTSDQSLALRDLLDVHEANSNPAMSGTFEDYLRLPQTIEQELPPRSDAISRYLDALDREFSKP